MIYILNGDVVDIIHHNGDIRKMTVSRYDSKDEEPIFLTHTKQTYGYSIGKIDKEQALNLIYRKKLSLLPFNKQMETNIQIKEGKISKESYALQGVRKTRLSQVISYIEQGLHVKFKWISFEIELKAKKWLCSFLAFRWVLRFTQKIKLKRIWYIMKTIIELYQKAEEKGHAKARAWEIVITEQQEGNAHKEVELKHYNTVVLYVGYLQSGKHDIQVNSTSQSDQRGINALLKYLRLTQYDKTLPEFRTWLRDTENIFTNDGILTSKERREKDLFIQRVEREDNIFNSGNITIYDALYQYDEERKAFQFIKHETIKKYQKEQ